MPTSLKTSLAYLRQWHFPFYSIFFAILLALVLTFSFLNTQYPDQINATLTGLSFMGKLTCFIYFSSTFINQFYFLILNGIDRKKTALAFVIDAFVFSLLFAGLFLLAEVFFQLVAIFPNITISAFEKGHQLSFLVDFASLSLKFFTVSLGGRLLFACFYHLKDLGKIILPGLMFSLYFLFGLSIPQVIDPLGIPYSLVLVSASLILALVLSLMVQRLNIRYKQ